MIKVLLKAKIKIHCDLCDTECENVWICKLDSIIGTRFALLCSHCERLLKVYSPTEIIKLVNSNILLGESNHIIS
jgi:hypothetical protein